MAVRTNLVLLNPLGRDSTEPGVDPEVWQEFDQGIVRLISVLLFTSYLCVILALPRFGYEDIVPLAVSSGYGFVSILILASFKFYRKPSYIRKYFTLVGDNAVVLFGLYNLGEYGMPLYAAMLLITIGYGARFGVRYLYPATLFSNLGLFCIIYSAGYWNDHESVGYSLLITNIVIPFFVFHLNGSLQLGKQQVLANAEKLRFLSSMSHEIRTPLTGIIGLSELMLSEAHDASTIRKVRTIQDSSKHLMSILYDILDFSKIEVGCMTIENKPFDLYAVLAIVSETCISIAKKKGIRFYTYRSPDTPYRLIGDHLRLRQVLMNLVNHAIKLTEVGYVELRVNVLDSRGASVKLQFEILDSGIENSDERSLGIFDQFSQVDDLLARTQGGAGLGFTIAGDLVKLMGSKLFVSGDTGKGGRFCFDMEFATAVGDSISRYEESSAITISSRASFEQTVRKHLALRGIRNLQLLTARDAISHIMYCSNDVPLPLIIIDEACFKNELKDFCKRINALTVHDLRTIVVTKRDIVPPEYYELDVGALITDLNDEKQFCNAIHTVLVDEETAERWDLMEKWKPQGRRSKRVLVAEDIEVNRYVLREVLDRVGYDVVITQNGKQALECLEEEAFDLCIVDMHMPELSGIEVVTAIKQSAGVNKDVPFIVLTANATALAKNQCDVAQVNAYLTKPIDMPQLLETVGRLVGYESNCIVQEEVVNSDTKSGGDREVLDVLVLDKLKMLGSSPDFIVRLVDHFQFDTNNLISNMHFSLRGQRYQQLVDEAHGVKGAAGNIGAYKLAHTAQQIYLATPEILEREGKRLLKVLKSDFKDSVKLLRAYCAKNAKN